MNWKDKSSLFVAATLFLAAASINPGVLRAQGPAGRLLRVSLPLQAGFFNGATALYITPEVGVDPNAPPAIVAAAKQAVLGEAGPDLVVVQGDVAARFNSDSIPHNVGILPGSTAADDIFVFTNFKQGNVLASAPHPADPANTDTNDSPLWQVNLVTRNLGYQGLVLTSQTDITTAASAGEVTIQKTPIIVECSVIVTPGAALLPGARVMPRG